MVMKTETKRELIAKLAKLGITGAAAELVIKEGAPARARARMEAVREAVLKAAGSSGVEGAALICLADLAGIGNKNSLEGHGICRHPALEQFPDKQQASGGAWDASIKDAFNDLVKGRTFFLCTLEKFRGDGGDVELPQGEMSVTLMIDGENPEGDASCVLEGEGAPWGRTLSSLMLLACLRGEKYIEVDKMRVRVSDPNPEEEADTPAEIAGATNHYSRLLFEFGGPDYGSEESVERMRAAKSNNRMGAALRT